MCGAAPSSTSSNSARPSRPTSARRFLPDPSWHRRTEVSLPGNGGGRPAEPAAADLRDQILARAGIQDHDSGKTGAVAWRAGGGRVAGTCGTSRYPQWSATWCSRTGAPPRRACAEADTPASSRCTRAAGPARATADNRAQIRAARPGRQRRRDHQGWRIGQLTTQGRTDLPFGLVRCRPCRRHPVAGAAHASAEEPRD
jgi:hypothetical protein